VESASTSRFLNFHLLRNIEFCFIRSILAWFQRMAISATLLPVRFAHVLFTACFILSSCTSLSFHDSARLMIVHPVNGSTTTSSSTRLLLRCVGACDDRGALVTFSSGENLQVHQTCFSFAQITILFFRCTLLPALK